MTSVFDDPEENKDDPEIKEAVKHFTDAIRAQRVEKKLSQLKILKISGIAQKTISEIETGGNFRMSNYIKICMAMGIVPRVHFLKYKGKKT